MTLRAIHTFTVMFKMSLLFWSCILEMQPMCQHPRSKCGSRFAQSVLHLWPSIFITWSFNLLWTFELIVLIINPKQTASWTSSFSFKGRKIQESLCKFSPGNSLLLMGVIISCDSQDSFLFFTLSSFGPPPPLQQPKHLSYSFLY